MPANDTNQLSDSDEDWSSTYSSHSEDDDPEGTPLAFRTSSEEGWASTGEFPMFPFTGQGSQNIGPAEIPIDFFKLFFNLTFMTVLVDSVNTHALEALTANTQPSSRITNWKDTDVDEMYVFLGLLFHMGHIKMNRINDYWKTSVLFDLPFRNFMSHDRFVIILRNLTFSDFSNANDVSDPNGYTKPIIDFFNNTMKTLVMPPKNLTISESVALWHGRLNGNQSLHGKPNKHGVKLYVLADTNGLTQKMLMFCSSNDNNLKGKDRVNKVVMMLMEDHLNAGHSLYLDSFYNTVELAEELLDKKTYLTGALRPNKSRNPLFTSVKLAKDKAQCKYNPRGVCITNYRDKKTILMISTQHNADLVPSTSKGKIVSRPKVVHEYNKYIKGVDTRDQMLSHFSCYNQCTRWYKKFLIHVMQVMMLNAFMMYNQKRQTISDFYDFRIDVITKLLNADRRADRQTLNARQLTTEGDEVIHWPKHLPKNKKGVTKRKNCRYCFVKNKIRKAATFFCPHCDKSPGLHLDCFKQYHGY